MAYGTYDPVAMEEAKELARQRLVLLLEAEPDLTARQLAEWWEENLKAGHKRLWRVVREAFGMKVGRGSDEG